MKPENEIIATMAATILAAEQPDYDHETWFIKRAVRLARAIAWEVEITDPNNRTKDGVVIGAAQCGVIVAAHKKREQP